MNVPIFFQKKKHVKVFMLISNSEILPYQQIYNLYYANVFVFFNSKYFKEDLSSGHILFSCTGCFVRGNLVQQPLLRSIHGYYFNICKLLTAKLMIVFMHIWCLINDIHEQVKVTKQLLNPFLARLNHMHNFKVCRAYICPTDMTSWNICNNTLFTQQ